MSKNLTKDEYNKRKKAEDDLKGGNDKIKPPPYLSTAQKKIFKYILTELEISGILCNLDVFLLTNCCIAIDRMQEAEKIMNKDILNKDALKIKESYAKELFRYTNELSLSPQSRAKLGNLNLNAQADSNDELLNALKD